MSRNTFFIFISLFMLSLTDAAQAQLVNYNRRNQYQDNTAPVINLKLMDHNNTAGQGNTIRTQKKSSNLSKSQTKPINKKIQTESASFSQTVTQLMSSNPRVSSRVERIYDWNRDGRLQMDEIKEMYGDVVASVDRRGSFSVSSDLLKPFDGDSNGQITRYELDSIMPFTD